MNDCEGWGFLGNTISRGENNDYVFHHTCITYVIKYYDDLRVGEVKDIIFPHDIHVAKNLSR